MATPSDPTTGKRLFCNTCKTQTNHNFKTEHLREQVDRDEFWRKTTYRLWVCAGCESVTLEVYYTDDYYEAFNERKPEPLYYPRRTENEVQLKHFLQLPPKLFRIYQETILAFNNDLDILCAVGLRALIEGICDNKEISGSKLDKKIEGLSMYLPQNIVSNLHSFRFIGNTAVHELTPPDKDDLRLAIEIVEDLLNFLYALDYKARILTSSQTENWSDLNEIAKTQELNPPAEE